MGMRYRILDYQNGKIISDIQSTQDVCTLLKMMSKYSTSWAVVSHNDDFLTSCFVEKNGQWFYITSVKEG